MGVRYLLAVLSANYLTRALFRAKTTFAGNRCFGGTFVWYVIV